MKGAAAAMPGTPPLLVQKRATRRFRAVRALAGRSTLYPAEGDARLGDDGAGRPTSLRVSSGVQQSDSGRIVIDAGSVTCAGPYEGHHPGFSIHYQAPSFRRPSVGNGHIAEARSLNASRSSTSRTNCFFRSTILDEAFDRNDQQGRIEGD